MTPTFDALVSLHAHLRTTLPDADVRIWSANPHSVTLNVGPQVGMWSDFEVRPELFRVARAIDPFVTGEAFSATSYTTWCRYRWTVEWDGVRVLVIGEGKGEPVVAPRPLPELKGVAA